jgi:hypothetical protein
MINERIEILKKIEERRNSKTILYVTGDRPGLETQIHQEVYDYFVNILDAIGVTSKISLVLYTRGGNTLAAWSIVNLIRQFCDTFEIIIPNKAQSAGTLISIGANTIVMTKQATLGPVDPSINTPLNPHIEGAPPDAKVPVSVEAVNGFLELAKSNMDNPDSNAIKDLIIQLSNKVHPLVLGDVYRSKTQIQMLSNKLLSRTGVDKEKIDGIVSFLCSESGSHDYTIHRREARDLGLNIEKPNDEFYAEIKSLYDDFSSELKLTERWDPIRELKANDHVSYGNKRCILESTVDKSYCFVTEGEMRKIQQDPQIQIQDNRIFEGWKNETAN